MIFLNTRSMPKTLLVLLAVPFSAVGAVWLLWLLGYNISIGVWVGLIALLGLDAETGIFMLLYLDLAYDQMKARGQMRNREDLREAIYHGAVKRVRPKVMTRRLRVLWAGPDHVVSGSGSRRHEADRSANDRWPVHIVPDGAARLSGDLLPPEMGGGSAPLRNEGELNETTTDATSVRAANALARDC